MEKPSLSSKGLALREEGMVIALTTRQDLVKLKLRALRTRVWFGALSRLERALIDLTIKCVEKVRSTVLARTISTIIHKILQLIKNSFMERAERVGHEIVERLCIVGERWENKTCSTWKCDICFTRFLGINALNT